MALLPTRTARRERTPVACCAPLGTPTLTDEEIAGTAALFKALADPTRVRLVHLLATTDQPACL